MSLMTKTLKMASVALAACAIMTAPVLASGGGGMEPENPYFTFEGPFGKFDQGQLQRGYKVYREVCAACHSMKLLSYRNLGEKGAPFYDEKYKNPNDNPYVKQIASEFEVADIDGETGDTITRKATPSDRFNSPYANSAAAAASNGGAVPPDLSVITKARPGGARYIYSFLIGFKEPPKGLSVAPGQYYNPYVNGNLATQWSGDHHHVPKGGLVAMPPQLTDGRVTFDDGTASTIDQQAQDVAAFLEWAADPHATQRKQTGVATLLYLLLLSFLTYVAYQKVWKDKH